MKIITLSSDFGNKDWFVAAMKAQVLSINPGAKVFDGSHGLEPFALETASFYSGMLLQMIPNKCIHVVVVDPGVGGARRPIIVQSDLSFFVGPDNGIFTQVYKALDQFKVFEIENKKYLSTERSSTFHGRDIFSPAAAWLSKGLPPSEFGKEIRDFVTLDLSPVQSSDFIEGRVVYIDHFGNLITNIGKDCLHGQSCASIQCGDYHINGLASHYGAVKDKEVGCLIASHGNLEIFSSCASAAEMTGLKIGDKVAVKKA